MYELGPDSNGHRSAQIVRNFLKVEIHHNACITDVDVMIEGRISLLPLPAWQWFDRDLPVPQDFDLRGLCCNALKTNLRVMVSLGCKVGNHCVNQPVMTAVIPLRRACWCGAFQQELMPDVRGITGDLMRLRFLK